MKPYIEDRLGNHYVLGNLTRRQKIKLQEIASRAKETTTAQVEMAEEAVFFALSTQYPNLTKEQYEDILDYNEQVYGFAGLYELLGALIESLFTQVGGEASRVHPYLQYKQEQEKAQEVQVAQEVEKTVEVKTY